eukprot:GHVN01072759.1.p1 GENE.GHVN01072759.1~~GHVN01072759.1.p1  ORF type:complete len:171 (-),score=18.64 GHVN01072759.1:354-866(-)
MEKEQSSNGKITSHFDESEQDPWTAAIYSNEADDFCQLEWTSGSSQTLTTKRKRISFPPPDELLPHPKAIRPSTTVTGPFMNLPHLESHPHDQLYEVESLQDLRRKAKAFSSSQCGPAREKAEGFKGFRKRLVDFIVRLASRKRAGDEVEWRRPIALNPSAGCVRSSNNF